MKDQTEDDKPFSINPKEFVAQDMESTMLAQKTSTYQGQFEKFYVFCFYCCKHQQLKRLAQHCFLKHNDQARILKAGEAPAKSFRKEWKKYISGFRCLIWESKMKK